MMAKANLFSQHLEPFPFSHFVALQFFDVKSLQESVCVYTHTYMTHTHTHTHVQTSLLLFTFEIVEQCRYAWCACVVSCMHTRVSCPLPLHASLHSHKTSNFKKRKELFYMLTSHSHDKQICGLPCKETRHTCIHTYVVHTPCVCVCICIYIYIYVYTYIYIYIYIYVCILCAAKI
jgi:hypothetical protein